MLNWRDIATLYRFEVTAALRERNIVVNSILVPLLLYPVLTWVMISGFTFVGSQTDKLMARVEVHGLGDDSTGARAEFVDLLDDADNIEVVSRRDRTLPAESEERRELVERIRSGELEALVEIEGAEAPTTGAAPRRSLPGNFTVRLTVDSSEDRSQAARQRIERRLDDFRESWLQGIALEDGVAGQDWALFELQPQNLASSRQMGALVLSLMLPLMITIMVAVGCFYPAVDATAGEKERSTWETTLTLATSRTNVVIAKYLYVASFGCLAGFLNVGAMVISMRALIANLLGDARGALDFTIPMTSIPVLILAALLLASFLAAGMMIFAAFARTFKEGQSMVTPFYLAVILPIILLNDPGIELSPGLALVPVANVALLIRGALSGEVALHLLALTCLASLVTIGLCLYLASFILRFEEVVTGSFEGSLTQFLRRHFRRSSTTESSP